MIHSGFKWSYDPLLFHNGAYTHNCLFFNHLFFLCSDDPVAQAYTGNSDVTYSEIKYLLKFQRQGNFIFTIISLPGAMINLLCTASFFLPTSSGEKIGLTVTLFLSQAVNLMLFSEYLPQGGNSIPLVGQYLVLSIIKAAFSVVYSVYDSRKSETDETKNENDENDGKLRDQNPKHVEEKNANNSKTSTYNQKGNGKTEKSNESANLANLRYGFVFTSRVNSVSPSTGQTYPKEHSDTSFSTGSTGGVTERLIRKTTHKRAEIMAGFSTFMKNNRSEFMGCVFAFMTISCTIVYAFLLFLDF